MHRHAGWLVIVLAAGGAWGGNIVDPAGGGRLKEAQRHEFTRPVKVYKMAGAEGKVLDGQLKGVLVRFEGPTENRPLLVMFRCWGGNINGTVGTANYEDEANDPFVALVIDLPAGNPTSVENTWYWGGVWKDDKGAKWSVPWFHNAVVELLNDILSGTFSVKDAIGCTIDPNRVYANGHSIGGSATHQIAIKHPEIFAAYHAHSGWTDYGRCYNPRTACHWGDMVGVAHDDAKVLANADQVYLGVDKTRAISAWDYTDLAWYFGKAGQKWNFRDPGFPTPYIYFTNGAKDAPKAQGDHLQPVLEESRRGYTFNRHGGGHSDGNFIRFRYLRNFRKNQSFLAFTGRDYGPKDVTTTGVFNDLAVHGWDPAGIVDGPARYAVKLTGKGTADVTLRRLQKLRHEPGTAYRVKINGRAAPQVTADAFGLITIPQVADDAAIELEVAGAEKVTSKAR